MYSKLLELYFAIRNLRMLFSFCLWTSDFWIFVSVSLEMKCESHA